jgi:hypothetical protein
VVFEGEFDHAADRRLGVQLIELERRFGGAAGHVPMTCTQKGDFGRTTIVQQAVAQLPVPKGAMSP